MVLLASGEFTCARFSPKGDRIATGLSDSTCQLWSAATGQPTGEQNYLKAGVSDLTFSRDGRLFATSAGDSVCVWRSSDGSAEEQLPNQSSTVSAIAFSPDSRLIATACEDGIARLWEAKTGNALSEGLRHSGSVDGIAFDANGTTLFCAAGDTLRLWNIATGLTSADHKALANFAREVSSVGLQDSARLQTHVVNSASKLRQLGAASTRHVSLLANWICSAANERTLTPFSSKKAGASPNE